MARLCWHTCCKFPKNVVPNSSNRNGVDPRPLPSSMGPEWEGMVMVVCRIRPILIAAGLILWLLFIPNAKPAGAFDLGAAFTNTLAVGAAYTTHLFLHELGHQVVADEVGADSHHMNFFTQKDGKFYPGLSTYKGMPENSRLPYAAGGERMAGYTFEYALESYRHEPSVFNKALLFFSGADFLAYTLLANYVDPDNDMYDPNLIRAETGIGKEMLLGMVAAKTLVNVYRIWDEKANFIPILWTDKKTAAFMIRFIF